MEQYPNGNYGISSYQVVSENELAVLCVSDHKVKVYDLLTKTLSYQFSYDKMSHPYLLAYSSSLATFYLYDNFKILSFTKKGIYLGDLELSRVVENEGVIQLLAIKNNLYAVCGYRITYTIVKDGIPLSSDAQVASKIDGVLDENGNNIKIEKHSKNSFSIFSSVNPTKELPILIESDDINNDFKYIAGTNDYLILARYFIEEENPYMVQWQMAFYSKDNKKIIRSIVIPSNFFTIQYNSIQVFENSIYQFFSTPEHAVLLKYNIKEGGTFNFEYPEEYQKGVMY